MAIESKWEERGLFLHMTGTATAQDLIDNILELTGHERADEIRYVVDDWSAIETVDFDVESIPHILAFCKVAAKINSKLTKVIVFPDKKSQRPLFDAMLQKMSGQLPWRLKLCQSVSEARDWLSKELKFDQPAGPQANPKFLNDHVNSRSHEEH